jgi:hypothetical protein
METIVLAVVFAGGLVAILATTAHRSRPRPQEALARVPRPTVRVLQENDELDDALRRAARFEREEAETRRRRADRYEARISLEPIADLRRVRPAPVPRASRHARSA